MSDGGAWRVGSQRFVGARRGSRRPDVPAFYIVPLMDMVIFATLLAFAFRARRDPAAHKRLIYLATMGLLIAAVARWPFAIVNRNAPVAALFSYVFLLALMS
jgi:FtsH-binding integral membrane protein